jgi:hypothetical protein
MSAISRAWAATNSSFSANASMFAASFLNRASAEFPAAAVCFILFQE